jgi:hypothetical protein
MSLRATPYILGGAGIAAFAVALNYTLRGRALEEVPGMPSRDPFKPPKPGELEASIPSHTVEVVSRAPANAIPAQSAQPAKKPSTSATNAAQLAAAALYSLVTTPPVNWGTRTAPNPAIAGAQRAMGGGLQPDGVYGPKTAARGAALLGRAFPARPASQPATKPAAAAPSAAAASYPKPPAASSEPRTSSADAPQPAAAAAKSAEETRTPKQAAQQLYTYVVPLIKAGNLAELGAKGKPNHFIANAQRDMRLIESDGIYGPKTAARGKELIGREFPSRTSKKRVSAATLPANWKVEPPGALTAVPEATLPVDPPAGPLPQLWPGAGKVLEQSPPAPSSSSTKRTPKEAAAALYALVHQSDVDWGTKVHPNTLIAAAQRDMGSVTADGVYGPKTAARAAALLGRAMPARGTFTG